MIYKYFGIRKNTGAINVYENNYKSRAQFFNHLADMNRASWNQLPDGMRYMACCDTSSSTLNNWPARKVK